MRGKLLAITLVCLGLIMVFGFASASDDVPAVVLHDGQTPPDGAEYVGSDTCFQCHSTQHRDQQQTLHPIMVQPVSEEGLVADFEAGEDVRTLEDGTVITIDDVALLMGNKYRQRFIAETEDGGMEMLPIQWNIAAQEWVTASPGDWLADCAGCHTTGFNAETLEYSELGVQCEACHGPGSAHVEITSNLPDGFDPNGEEVKSARDAIVKTVDSALCGQCHNRGTDASGEHGYPVGYVVGGPLDDTMFSSVAPTGEDDDANFWPDGTEKKHREQYIAWSESRHGNALATIQDSDHGGDYCLPCHSTDYNLQDTTFDEPVTVENAQFSIECVECHDPHGAGGNENQLNDPESYDLCVSCHTGTGGGNSVIRVGATVHHPMREMFEGVSFLGLDPNPSPHFANEAYGPVCASCHMVATAASAEVGDIPSHTWQVVIPAEAAEGQPDSCTSCHTLERNEDNTPENLTYAIEAIQEDTMDWVDDLRADLADVTDAHPEWADVAAEDKGEAQLLAERIHTLLSFVEADGSWGFHNPGYTEDILSEAEDLLDELLDME